MSNGSRVIFTRFSAPESSRLSAWRSHFAAVVGAPLADADPGSGRERLGASVWHLVSANNRTLARSPSTYANVDDAVDSASALIASSAEVQVHFVSAQSRLGYGWYGTLIGETRLTCARWFATERDRRQSIELALNSLAAATTSPNARELSGSERGRRG